MKACPFAVVTREEGWQGGLALGLWMSGVDGDSSEAGLRWAGTDLLLVVKLKITCLGKVGEVNKVTRKRDGNRVGLTIIFSTIARVSPSSSLSFEFSGVIFVVSILGAWVTTLAHHVCWLNFSR